MCTLHHILVNRQEEIAAVHDRILYLLYKLFLNDNEHGWFLIF